MLTDFQCCRINDNIRFTNETQISWKMSSFLNKSVQRRLIFTRFDIFVDGNPFIWTRLTTDKRTNKVRKTWSSVKQTALQRNF